MLISVITPTHNPAYLLDCWESLKQQTDRQWEWVIVPNGGATGLAAEIVQDPRVRVYQAPTHLDGSIGALKHFATQHAQGDLIVELDHDDMLAPNALQQLRQAADVTLPQVLYSDFAMINAASEPWTYPKTYGWESYAWRFRGQALLATRSWAPIPSNLCWLQFAPNHVRAWTRLGLLAGGGFNPERPLADDYELLLKCYAASVDFIQIRECLYVYRQHPNSTTDNAVNQKRVATAQAEIAKLHLESCVAEWCRRYSLHRIELSAFTKLTTDIELLSPTPRATADGYTFTDALGGIPDNSVGQIRLREYLQYLPPDAAVPLFEELYRILAPGGWVSVDVPSADYPGGYASPAYRSYWNQATFLTWCRAEYAQRGGVQNARFVRLRSWDTWNTDDEHRDGLYHTRVDMAALKGQNQAGRLEI